MTNGTELDEIRSILAELARAQAAYQQRSQADFEQMRQRQQQAQVELEQMRQRQQQSQMGFEQMQQRQQQAQLEFEQMRQQSQAEMAELRALIASNARAAEANSNGMVELRQRTQETLAGIDDAVEMITSEAQRNAQEHEDFRSFIRGLQTEMRRIWENRPDESSGEA